MVSSLYKYGARGGAPKRFLLIATAITRCTSIAARQQTERKRERERDERGLRRAGKTDRCAVVVLRFVHAAEPPAGLRHRHHLIPRAYGIHVTHNSIGDHHVYGCRANHIVLLAVRTV